MIWDRIKKDMGFFHIIGKTASGEKWIPYDLWDTILDIQKLVTLQYVDGIITFRLCEGESCMRTIITHGVCCGPCNPSIWEADIWGWLEVRRSAMLHYTVNHHVHWACQQYGHSGGTREWIDVKRCHFCLQATSCIAKCFRKAAVGHWFHCVCQVL